MYQHKYTHSAVDLRNNLLSKNKCNILFSATHIIINNWRTLRSYWISTKSRTESTTAQNLQQNCWAYIVVNMRHRSQLHVPKEQWPKCVHVHGSHANPCLIPHQPTTSLFEYRNTCHLTAVFHNSQWHTNCAQIYSSTYKRWLWGICVTMLALVIGYWHLWEPCEYQTKHNYY